MPDNLDNPGQADRLRVNVNEPHEIDYWTKILGVPEVELREAVAEVGVMASDVRMYLKK